MTGVEGSEKDPISTNGSAGETIDDPAASAPFVDGWGVRPADLARVVQRDLPLARDRGDALWGYHAGVWTSASARDLIRRAVAHRLGNRYRPAYVNAVIGYLIATAPVFEIRPVERFINVRNGLLDWRTGDLLPHDPDVRSSIQLPVRWDPDASCPRVERWLREVLPEDLLAPTDDGPGFLWELVGYLCYSGNPFHKAILFRGSGRNGKGTLLRLITALLGAENVSSNDLHALVDNRFRAAELLGKLANVAGDVGSGLLGSTALFKAVTGGDSITAERKYGQPFDFTPFAVPISCVRQSGVRIPVSVSR